MSFKVHGSAHATLIARLLKSTNSAGGADDTASATTATATITTSGSTSSLNGQVSSAFIKFLTQLSEAGPQGQDGAGMPPPGPPPGPPPSSGAAGSSSASSVSPLTSAGATATDTSAGATLGDDSPAAILQEIDGLLQSLESLDGSTSGATPRTARTDGAASGSAPATSDPSAPASGSATTTGSSVDIDANLRAFAQALQAYAAQSGSSADTTG